MPAPEGNDGHSPQPSESIPAPEKTTSLASPRVESVSSETEERTQHGIVYIEGVRFWLITSAIAISLFLTNLEIPIVTTSLVSITNDLGGFEDVGWVISSYLLGFVGVLVVFAKLSDIFGRKLIFSIAICTFIVFSAACGASQTLQQLIIFRAFQGAGGAGCYALGTAIITELVPPEKFAKYAAHLGIVYAMSLLLGPIVGGAISSNTSWRWVFLINVPLGIPPLIFAATAIPRGFPFHGSGTRARRNPRSMLSKGTLQRIDAPGAILLLCATLSLTAGFEEADSRFPWRSAYVIALLSVSGVLWILLFIWEQHVTLHSKVREPILPWRFMKNRVMIGLMLDSLFLGGAWFVAIFQLPQKFQIVHGTSALQAGIRLMPFTFAAPIGSIVASTLAGKKKVPPIYLLLVSAVLQVIGFALLATLPVSTHLAHRTYGYQVIAGLGCGISLSTHLLLVPFVVEFGDKAVGLGAVSQVRVMGGAIVLAVAVSVFNSYARPEIRALASTSSSAFSQSQLLDSVYQHLAQLPPEIQQKVLSIFAHGYNLQMWVLCGFAAGQIPATLLMWQRAQITV